MDQRDGDTQECVSHVDQIEYNPYSSEVKGVGEFKEIDLNTPCTEGLKLHTQESKVDPDYEGTDDLDTDLNGSEDLDYKYDANVLFPEDDIVVPENGHSMSKQQKFIVAIAFILCFLSNCAGHFIREPLFTTKVNIQKSFGSTTLQLGYLDLSYMTFYGTGQMITPIVFPRSHVVMFVCFFHFIIGVCHSLLYITESLSAFVVAYGVTGFSCAILWLALYNDLHSWLPLKYRLILITFWCSSAEIGLILGTIMCAHIQNETRWKVLFVITSSINFTISFLLFTCYIKPKKNSEYSSASDNYVDREKLFDPMNIGKENYRKIVNGVKSLYGHAPVELELSTLPTTTMEVDEQSSSRSLGEITPRLVRSLGKAVRNYFKRTSRIATKVIRGHVDVLKRVKHLGLYVLGYTSLKCVRNCFAFWISFYLTTNLKYSIQNGIYATLVFQIGSCFASVVSGMLSKLVLKQYHTTSCTIAGLFSFLTLCSFYFIDMKSMFVCYSFVFMVGFTTNSAEVLITTRGLKSLCEQSFISLGTTFSMSTFLSVFLGYISIYIAHHMGWNYMFLYLSCMMLLSAGALGVPSRSEIKRIQQPVL